MVQTNGGRYDREVSVAGWIEGRNGWNRSPYDVKGMVGHLATVYPMVPIVDDGPTPVGRGSTGADLFRVRNVGGGCVRHDVLSIKTTKLDEGGGKLPSKVSLSTGNNGAPGMLSSMLKGAPLPSLIFAADDTDDDSGVAIMLDMGKIVRESGLTFAPEEGFARGKAPPVYIKWSAARKSGTKGTHIGRKDMNFPCIDQHQEIGGETYPVRRWVSADRVQYAEINVSLYACGIRRDSWVPMNGAKLPAFVESFAWNEAAGY